jgi:hypothetical protein
LKNWKKKSNGHFKIFVIFSHVFPIILHNIGLYIYIVRYRYDIKILGFLQNVSLIFLKKLKKNLVYDYPLEFCQNTKKTITIILLFKMLGLSYI